MTLIFSNDNRFLFNIKGNNQILELCYSKRFSSLKFDPFFTYPYNPKPQSPLQISDVRRGRWLCHQDTSALQIEDLYQLCFARRFVWVLGRSPIKASLSFAHHKSKICNTCTKLLTNRRFVLGSPFEKSSCFRALPHTNLLAYKSSICKSFAHHKYKSKICVGFGAEPHKSPKALVSWWQSHLPLRASKICCGTKPQNDELRSYKSSIYMQRFVLVSSFLGKKNHFNLFYKKARFTTPSRRLIGLFFVNDCFTFLKEKLFTIKQFLPKPRVWGFAFGSSFLLVIITSILQRQEQNNWFLPVSKNQMPGFSRSWGLWGGAPNPKQESSWECLENITLKHIFNKKNSTLSEAQYKYPSSKGLVKQIDCYKNICSLAFSESWNQHSLHNYTAVFSKSLDQSTVYAPADIFFRFYPSSVISNQRFENGAFMGQSPKTQTQSKESLSELRFERTSKHRKKQNKSIKSPITFGPFFNTKDPRTISSFNPLLTTTISGKTKLLANQKFALTGTATDPKVSPFSYLLEDFSLTKKWLAQPWYKMHARVPPKKGEFITNGRLNLIPYGLQIKDLVGLRPKAKQNQRKTGSRSLTLINTNGYKNKVNFENDSIPSKLSCSTRVNCYKPYDRLKNLFYNSNSFSVETQIFEENSQEKDFTYDFSFSLKEKNSNLEKLIDRNRFLFLQQKNLFELDTESAQHEKTYFDWPLVTVKRNGSSNKVLKVKPGRRYRFDQSIKYRVCVESDKKGCKNKKQNLSKSAEKVSTYFLYKQNSVSNRLMSGYQLPETKGLQLKKGDCLNKIFIKVPFALPFYESRIKTLFEKDLFFIESVEAEPALKEKDFVSSWVLGFGAKHHKSPMEAVELRSSKAKRVCETNNVFSTTRSFKKLPYRQLCLNELKEVEPLFDQVSKSFRVSPYHFTFKKDLFTDYHDYLSWPKDTPAAISILPSVEDEQPIKDSWFADQAGLKEKLEGKKSLDRLQTENERSLSSLPEGAGGFATKKNQIEGGGSTPSVQEETAPTSLSIGEDEDKKREITKFEWLKQVREAEHLVEKRKKLQELAYPNQKALYRKRLQDRPGMIQSLFVSDRKLSFFGISNIFPKRLVAQDQKQINSQILRDEEDRRYAFLVEHASLKNNDIDRISGLALDKKEDVSIENLLKSVALYNLKKSNGFNLKKQFVSGGTKTSSEKEMIMPKPASFNKKSSMPFRKKELLSSLRTRPRNQQKSNEIKNDKTGSCNALVKPVSALFNARQHPIYTPHRRLRLRAPQLSASSQSSNSQSRIDDLTLHQSHRWWQKRRTTSSLLGAPSKRYLVMPEIRTQDWKKIIEWQLKTYFLEEEKRVEPLILEKAETQNVHYQSSFDRNTQVLGELESQTKHLFKIKRIAVYLPWTTLKKSLKKPFEWPLTGLSYHSPGQVLYKSKICDERSSKACDERSSLQVQIKDLQEDLYAKPRSQIKDLRSPAPVKSSILKGKKICNVRNKKAQSCFRSSISPHFKASFLSLSNLGGKACTKRSFVSPFGQRYKPNTLDANTLANLSTDAVADGLHENSVYKPFLFETIDQNSHLLLHQLLLAVAIKQLVTSIYKIFGNVIAYKLKNSSLAVLLLPLVFNATYQKNQISEYSTIKKRLRDLAGSEDTISALSEIVWYLRNSCRGRLLPRGIVLVETLSSESTDYLKAIGGEAQVPVIVQSLRALPFTQNHPQRRLEKILTFAQKRAPCILFLDDLDSIGQSRTLLLKNNYSHLTRTKTEFFSFSEPANLISGSNGETFEKRKWKKDKNEFDRGTKRELCTVLPKANRRFVLGTTRRFADPDNPSTSTKGRGIKENEVLHLSETEKIVQQRRVDLMLRLLTVMDGITHLNGVLIVTTSKNPRLLDPALLRPGRFEKRINLRLPNKKKRIELLKFETAKIGHMTPMPWDYLGAKTEDMTGTEIFSAINHSAFRAIIQSTVMGLRPNHTFATLEYGISCANGHLLPIEKYKSSICKKGQLKDRFEQEPNKYCSSLGGKACTKRSFVSPSKIFDFKGQRWYKSKICNARRSAFFLKNIFVQNPYKTFLSKGENQLTKASDPTQKLAKIQSRISFYQAGKGVLSSSIFSATNKQVCKKICRRGRLSQIFDLRTGLVGRSPKPTSHQENYRDTCFGFGAKPLSFAHHKPYKSKICNTSAKQSFARRFVSSEICTTRSYFAKKLVRLYSGQACESLYLDSIACFKSKNKELTTLFSQLSFLHSALSCKETLHAFSLMEEIKTNFQCYSVKNRCTHTRSYKSSCKAELCSGAKPQSMQKQRQRLYNTLLCKRKGVSKNIRRLTSLRSTSFFKKGSSLGSNNFGCLRKRLQLVGLGLLWGSAPKPTGPKHKDYERRDKNSWSYKSSICTCTCMRSFVCPSVQKVSESIKVFHRQSGNWYRVYLPKIEQNQSNREWLLPDIFSDQHISLLKQKDLQNCISPSLTLQVQSSALQEDLYHRRFVQLSSKVYLSVFPSRKKPYCSRFDFVNRTACFAPKEGSTFLADYNMVLRAFYIAFQNCNENRELLDLLADHLIRFKVVRLHELVRIGTFYF